MVCLIDGFNLYHSLRDCERDTGARVRWLDVWGLCASLLHTLPDRCVLSEVVFFSALAQHVENARPGTVARHLHYLDALRATGVSVRLGHFKRRAVACPACVAVRWRYEEKETDVAIASRLLESETRRRFDVALLVTGDTDLVPAVAFPYRRVNRQLRFAADISLRLGTRSYAGHQLPTEVRASGGRRMTRPAEWS